MRDSVDFFSFMKGRSPSNPRHYFWGATILRFTTEYARRTWNVSNNMSIFFDFITLLSYAQLRLLYLLFGLMQVWNLRLIAALFCPFLRLHARIHSSSLAARAII